MALPKEVKNAADGTVGMIRDGDFYWTEPGLRGGTVTYSRPVREDDEFIKIAEGEDH